LRGLGKRQLEERARTQKLIIISLLRDEPLTFEELFKATKELKKNLSRSTFYIQLKNLLKEGIVVQKKGWYELDKPIDTGFMKLYFNRSYKLVGIWHPDFEEIIKKIREKATTSVKKLPRKEARKTLCSYARWNPQKKGLYAEGD
jgi:DNA-binding transcriptional ArsR family regulator